MLTTGARRDWDSNPGSHDIGSAALYHRYIIVEQLQ